jgi:tetratricopeptide (TPR) repeat protein
MADEEEISPATYSTLAVKIKSFTLPKTGPLTNVWAQCRVLLNGEANEEVWYADAEEESRTELVDFSPPAAEGEEGEEGEEPVAVVAVAEDDDAADEELVKDLEYAQASRDIAMTEQALSSLIQCKLQVSLYSGDTRDVTADTLVGTVEINLVDSIMEEINDVFELTVPVAEGEEAPVNGPVPKIDIQVELDEEMQDKLLGLRMLSFKNAAMGSLPSAWIPEDGTPEEIVADPAKNRHKYTVSFLVPTTGTGTNALGTTHEINVEDGKLAYTDGKWCVEWAGENTVVLLKETVKKWRLAVDKAPERQLLRAKITRQVGDDAGGGKKGDTDADWNCQTSFNLAALVAPGTETTTLTGVLSTPSPEDADPKDMAEITRQAEILQQARSSVSVTAELNIAMKVKAPDAVQPVLKPTDLIPTRPELPEPERDAAADLQAEVKVIAAQLAEEMLDLFSDGSTAGLPYDERRRKLLFSLNSGGKYQMFKEKLKQKIVRVVREHFPQAPTGGGAGGVPSAADAFYSELYVYLMEHVHSALNDAFKGAVAGDAAMNDVRDPSVTPADTAALNRLLTLAEEAEAGMEWERASQFHRDRITMAEQKTGAATADIWYDYACYCLRRDEQTRGAECLRQCIEIDRSHVQALQTYGSLLCEQEQYGEAESFLKGAIAAEATLNKSPLASARTHALLALFFNLGGTEDDTNGTLTRSELEASCRAGGDIPEADVLQTVAEYLLDLHLPRMAECTISLLQEATKASPNRSAFRLSIRILTGRQLMLQEDWDGAEKQLTDAIDIDRDSANAHITIAGLQYSQGRSEEARDSYARALALLSASGLSCSLQLYLRLGALYLQSDEPDAAKEVYLRGCRAAGEGSGSQGLQAPVASLWLGVGIACLKLEEWEGAEQCLAEANILNNQNEKVWGYLSLFCLTVKPTRSSEADQALEQALRHGLQLGGLLRELGSAYEAADKLEVAEKLFRRSVAAQDSPVTRLRLGDVLNAQNYVEAALAQYRNVIGAEQDRQVRAQTKEKALSLLDLLGRAEEAEALAAEA